MLGRLRAVLPTGTVDRFRTQRAGWILAYLALRIGQTVPRERLIDLFWPEMDLDQGRKSLNNALSSLRRQLEPPGTEFGSILFADRQNLRLNEGAVETDVREFDVAIRRSSADGADVVALLRRATELYSGDLLPGCYEEWASLEGRRLLEAFLDASERLSDALEERGERGEAVAVMARAVAADPYRETLYARKIRLHLALGQPPLAAETYGEFERLLADELGEEPSSELRTLVEGLPRPAPRSSKPAAPQRVIEEIPVVATAPRFTSNLPRPTSRFFGREAERGALVSLLTDEDVRLVTLLGPGGAGKTRLAIEAARGLEEAFEGGAWWVGFADLNDGRLVGETIARAMRLSSSEGGSALENVLARLGSDRTLLVLDNLEQLIDDESSMLENGEEDLDAATGVVRLLLERAPGLRILATSRHPLRLDGEYVVPLPPLDVPPAGTSSEDVLRSASASLYLDRAKQARPDFAINERNSEDVARLCRILEGMPLAIEMAAAWAKVVPPGRMLERLSQRLDDLTSRRRDLPARHQSLRATIEWSYDLLTEPQREMLEKLSVFRGGWTLEAAESVCTAGEERWEIAELLLSLVEKSLVVAEDEGTRYRFLETVRQFAADRLGEGGAEARARHYRYFCDLAAGSWPRIQTDELVACLDQLEGEIENFRAALEWSTTLLVGVEAEITLASWLRPFWDMRGYWREGRDVLETALARPGLPAVSPDHSRALIGAAVLSSNLGDLVAARAYYERCLEMRRALGDVRGVASVAMGLGGVAIDERDFEAAGRFLREALETARALDDDWLVAAVLGNLGVLAHNEADFEAALGYYEENLAIYRRTGEARGIATALHNIAQATFALGRFPEGYRALREGLRWEEEVADPRLIYCMLGLLGKTELRQGRTEYAGLLVGAAMRIRDEIGAPDEEELLPVIAGERSESFQASYLEGRTWGTDLALNRAQVIAAEAV